MYPDVRQFDRFYQTRLGEVTKLCLNRRLNALWPNVKNLDMLALGFASPYLSNWSNSCRRLINAMPARQGVAQWPSSGPVRSLLLDPMALPFMHNSFDRVLLAHCLEEVADPALFLHGLSKILAPSGRVVLVIPHRIGLWASHSGTPFGHGRAFSFLQISKLLQAGGFEVTAHSQALHVPPVNWLATAASAHAWERTGEIFWPFFGGVLLVEATKNRLIDPSSGKTQPVYCPEPI